MSGSTGTLSLYRVGTQYEDLSTAGLQLLFALTRSLTVVVALVTSLPKKLCMCEAPGSPGKTIGSSGRRCENGQSARNSATRTAAGGIVTGRGWVDPPVPNTWNPQSGTTYCVA